MDLKDVIIEAQKLGSQELRIWSGATPAFKSTKGWNELSSGTCSAKWVRETFFSVLNEDQRSALMTHGFLEGELPATKNGPQMRVQFSMTTFEDGFHCYFNWDNADVKIEDFALPTAVLDVIKKSQGLTLIGGPIGSGKTTLAKLIATNMNTQGAAIAVFSDTKFDFEGFSCVNFPTERLSAGAKFLRGFDLVVVDSTKTMAWKNAVTIAEMGCRVIMTTPFIDLENCIYRLAEKIEPSTDLGLNRLAHVMQAAIGVRLVSGLEEKRQAVLDMLVVGREIRAALLQKNWPAVQATMQTLGEKTGMRTFNQSLLNLMLKRKIDFKIGFAESPAPQELDKMLERIGI